MDRGPGTNVVSIDLTPATFNLVVGHEAPLQATALDEGGHALADVAVVWSVKDTTVASVSPSGVVTARAVGNTQIAASANGVSAIAALAVQPPPVASVLVQPLTQTLVLGQSATLTATPRDVNGAALAGRVITWTSSDDAVAAVSQSGQITTHATGTTTVTATSESISGSATIVVTPVPVGSVTVLPTSVTVATGQSATLSAAVGDTAGRVVTDRAVAWASSDLHVAVVSSTGVVTGVAPGTATISATSEGKSGTSAVTVVEPAIASVAVQPASTGVLVASSTTLTAEVVNTSGSVVTNATVVWSSNNANIARVSSDGVVTGVAPGTATITAMSGGKSAIATVTVTAPVASVVVSPATVFLRKGGTVQLSAKVYDAANHGLSGRSVTWQSSDDHIATVTVSGLVAAKKSGTVTISATVEGKVGTTKVTVTN